MKENLNNLYGEVHDEKADVGSESNDDSEYESYDYESEMHVGFEDSCEWNNEFLEDEMW